MEKGSHKISSWACFHHPKTIHIDSNREWTQVRSGDFIYNWVPKYKLWVEEDTVHDIFDQRSICRGICMSGKSLNQLMIVVTTGEARLEPPEFTKAIIRATMIPWWTPWRAISPTRTGTSWMLFSSKSPPAFRAPAALFATNWRASNSSVRDVIREEKNHQEKHDTTKW